MNANLRKGAVVSTGRYPRHSGAAASSPRTAGRSPLGAHLDGTYRLRFLWGVRAFALIMLLAGCVSDEDRGRRAATLLSSWIGASADELIGEFGIPTREYRLAGGGRLIEYFKSRTINVNTGLAMTPVGPGCSPEYDTQATVRTTPGGYKYRATTKKKPCLFSTSALLPTYAAKEVYCKFVFTVSPAEVVIDWKYEGNGC